MDLDKAMVEEVLGMAEVVVTHGSGRSNTMVKERKL